MRRRSKSIKTPSHRGTGSLLELTAKFRAVWPLLDERTRRLMAASEAKQMGYGGVSLVRPGRVDCRGRRSPKGSMKSKPGWRGKVVFAVPERVANPFYSA